MVYTLFATGGTWRFGPGDLPYHDLLGEAFLAGQLHLKVEPDPRLLTLPNPYDPSQNGPLRLHDASLYQGRYYLYWGPVPGLLHALWRLVTQAPLYASVVGVGAAIVASASFWVILQRLRQRYFPSGAPWVIWGSSLAFALGGIMPYLVGRPSVWHEPLVMAVAFLVPAWYMLLLACEPGAARRRYLLWSGVLLGGAIGSRASYLAFAAGPGLVLGWALLRARSTHRRAALLDLLTFAAPVALTGLLLLLYNLVRFGSPLEFGQGYQLQGSSPYYEMTRLPDGSVGSFFNPRLITQNVALYLFGLPTVELAYPYFSFAWATTYAGTGFMFPDVSRYRGVLVEPPVFSVFLMAPTGLLAFLLPALFASDRRAAGDPVRMWATGVALGALLTLLLLSSGRGVTARYAADMSPALMLLGALALVAAPSGFGAGRRTLVRALAAFAMIGWGVSLLLGVLLGFGVWVYGFPAQATQARALSNEWIARLGATLRPDAVQSSIGPTERTTWRQFDGHYLQDGTIYLRAPERGTILVLDFASELPAGSELAIEVKGETRMRGPMLAGQQTWWTPPLTDLAAGEIVPIRLALPGQAARPPGSRVPLVVSGLHFTRGPAEAELYRGAPSDR